MSKAATASFRYVGNLEALRKACLDACQQMSLKVKSQTLNGPEGFQIEASEKMKWMTTNWPVSFKIVAKSSGTDWAVLVTAGTAMFSITQDFNNQHKARELADLIQVLAPS